ncbi:hypothetical protein RQP46_002392 [Phenoliferia psychrophenolica]
MARASFTTLPLELKARIAEMTSYQEEMWLQRVTDPDERAGHMSSLSSLALVNKEFRELAAKHQFRSLDLVSFSPADTVALIRTPLVDFVTLGVIDQDPATDLSSISPIRLPSLQILSLVASPAHLPQLFRILKCTSTLSDFCHYSDPNDALVPTDPALLTFLDLYPSLRHVWLWNVNFEGPPGVETPAALIPSPSFLAAYAKVVHSRGLDPGVLMEHYLSPFHRHAKLDYTENEAARLKDALGRTLDFGKSELERMFAEGSIARAVGWVGKLKALEDERLAWKD